MKTEKSSGNILLRTRKFCFSYFIFYIVREKQQSYMLQVKEIKNGIAELEKNHDFFKNKKIGFF